MLARCAAHCMPGHRCRMALPGLSAAGGCAAGPQLPHPMRYVCMDRLLIWHRPILRLPQEVRGLGLICGIQLDQVGLSFEQELCCKSSTMCAVPGWLLSPAASLLRPWSCHSCCLAAPSSTSCAARSSRSLL